MWNSWSLIERSAVALLLMSIGNPRPAMVVTVGARVVAGLVILAIFVEVARTAFTNGTPSPRFTAGRPIRVSASTSVPNTAEERTFKVFLLILGVLAAATVSVEAARLLVIAVKGLMDAVIVAP
jgi:hypothetical protein